MDLDCVYNEEKMIVSVFGPCGIVTASSDLDTFYELREKDDEYFAHKIGIEGLPHMYTFWDKYVLVYNCINQNVYDARMPYCLAALTDKWLDAPSPQDFMPYLKKLIVDNNIQIIGVVSGYFEDSKGTVTPYVYQILGEEIRRVNIDSSGNINYNCIYLEKEPIVGKLLRQVRMRNGDEWEEQEEYRFRYDLFSITKSIDFCGFVIKTNHYIDNINSFMYETPINLDIAVVAPESIDIIKKQY